MRVRIWVRVCVRACVHAYMRLCVRDRLPIIRRKVAFLASNNKPKLDNI